MFGLPQLPSWFMPASVVAVLLLGIYVTRLQLNAARADVGRLTAEAVVVKERGQQLASEADARARAVEAKDIALNAQIEKDAADAHTKIAALHAANVELAAHGLYDPAARCGGNPVPSPAHLADGTPDAGAGCRLSDETSRFLVAFAADADRAATYAQSCHAWAVGVSRQ